MADTVVERLIRHIWGFVSSPAPIEEKQMAFNEAATLALRDRTQIAAKGPTGLLHYWGTIEERDDAIADAITSSLAGVVLPADMQILKAERNGTTTTSLQLQDLDKTLTVGRWKVNFRCKIEYNSSAHGASIKLYKVTGAGNLSKIGATPIGLSSEILLVDDNLSELVTGNSEYRIINSIVYIELDDTAVIGVDFVSQIQLLGLTGTEIFYERIPDSVTIT